MFRIQRGLGAIMKKLGSKKPHDYVLIIEKSISHEYDQLVPKGCLPIYVGEERKRYVVPLVYLSSMMFQALLDQFEEEIDAKVEGPIAIPCSTQMCEWVLDRALAEETS